MDLQNFFILLLVYGFISIPFASSVITFIFGKVAGFISAIVFSVVHGLFWVFKISSSMWFLSLIIPLIIPVYIFALFILIVIFIVDLFFSYILINCVTVFTGGKPLIKI